MGYGDDIIGTGLARAARATITPPPKWKVGFGDGRKILWGPWSEEMFANNPHIARPGAESTVSVWIDHYKGKRKYNVQSPDKQRWIWNYGFKVQPGEFFFDDEEQSLINYERLTLGDFVVVEPNVPWQKSVAVNKDWGDKYFHLTERLTKSGIQVVQFMHKNSVRRLRGVTQLQFQKFREVIATLSLAKLYIGPEGGMHHAAAATNVKAVVIMGGFIPPSVVGYDFHTNLTGGSQACGSIQKCSHCQKAMERISVDEVFTAAMEKLK